MTSKEVIRRARRIRNIRLIRQRGVFMKFGAKIRAYFFTGILVTAPVAITFYMAYKIVMWIDHAVANLIPDQVKIFEPLPFTVPGIGILVLLVGFTLIGMFAAGFMGRFFIKLGEWIVYKVPLISSIYSLLKQVFETFLSKKKQSFNKVVLLEYPRKGLWIIGFVSGDTNGEVKDKLKDKMINVFVPTTPNPTSGFLIFVPKKDVEELDMSVEDALKFVISCGIVTPEPTAKLPKKK